MGTLVEVTVQRLSDKANWKGHAWTRENGTLEAFWYEDDIRLTYFFDAKGNQIGGKTYMIHLPK